MLMQIGMKVCVPKCSICITIILQLPELDLQAVQVAMYSVINYLHQDVSE